jgi:class 3 adenylate cyclase/alpha-beta hydrolase superfamily lysophospholipase
VAVRDLPETRYVAVGEADVAYQVFGTGPVDVVYFWGLGTHVELNWETPADAEYLRRLGSMVRVVTFDRRGTGASDGVARSAMPTWEDWAEDIGAVLDGVAWDRAALVAENDAGPIAILFAVTHPERVSALVLSNTTARMLAAPDYPAGLDAEAVEAGVRLMAKLWGTTDLARMMSPSLAGDEMSLRSIARCQRASATPRTAEAQFRYLVGVDVRHALPLVQVPTLVVHNRDNRFFPLEQGRYLADHISGAELVVLSGSDSGASTVTDPYLDALGRFLTGQRPVPEPDRVLATVLFTDIVRSTGTAAGMGDRRWRQLLDMHDRVVRQELVRFSGREINTTGDGFVMALDGPARGVRCGLAIMEALASKGIRVRAGVHTGECERRGDDLAGVAVHIAARVAAAAGPGEVLVSGAIPPLVVGSGIDFEDRGDHELKGVPGVWRLFRVVS